MPVRFEPSERGVSVVASGVDLRRPLEEADVGQIVKMLDRYPVMVFHDQPISQTEQVEIAKQFGPLDSELSKITKRTQTRLEYDTLTDISNLGMSGDVGARDTRQTLMNIGNMTWHSDSSFMKHPFRYSMLSAQTVAAWGGQTEWTDLRQAYDALDERTKDILEDKVAEHFAFHSRMQLGFTYMTPEELEIFPPVRWPLVRTHPGSGRKVLFVGSHLREIFGMSIPEGRQLLLELLEHATQRQFIYQHQWQVGDFVIWDNRATLHRGRRFDLDKPRAMRRVATVDDVASLPNHIERV
jgi:alpha-ketoglutarate-dependent 2,4-dichlorophenoxyacetate dioxygenase